MPLFGDVDANEVPDDPFFVDDGTWTCVLQEIRHVKTDGDRPDGLSVSFEIIEDCDFKGNTIQQYGQIYPDLSEEEVTPEIRKAQSRTKAMLLGVGVTVEDMNAEDFLKLITSNYRGGEYEVTVKNRKQERDGEERSFTNVTKVVPV